MIGELFAINAINVTRAAIRETERSFELDEPVEFEPVEQKERLVVRIAGTAGRDRDVDVDEASIHAWHDGHDIDVNRLVVELAAKIRMAAQDMLIDS